VRDLLEEGGWAGDGRQLLDPAFEVLASEPPAEGPELLAGAGLEGEDAQRELQQILRSSTEEEISTWSRQRAWVGVGTRRMVG